ncbi:MAG TPA: hypothetical protein VKD72_36490, partial [Gemmataceae bacterium]|nr:hypothetical protein [Gemmataceae bacterium]
MAGTVQIGNVSTEETLGPSAATAVEGEKQIDMDEKIRRLDPDDTQFTTLTSRLDSRQAVREKVNWLEEEDFPRQVTAANAQLVGDTQITVNSGQAKILQANDLLRNMRTGEGVRALTVNTSTNVVTITRGVGSALGGIAAAAINAGDVFLVVADGQPQGSDFPTPRYLARVLGFNYT